MAPHFYEVSRSHTTTHHSRQDSSERVISSSQRPLPHNTQQTNIHAPRRAENFYLPLKIRRLRPGLNPRTWVPKASTLPLDHRSRLNQISGRKIHLRTESAFAFKCMSYFSITQLLEKRTEEAWWHALHSMQVISPQVIKSQIPLLSDLLQFNDYFTTIPFRSLEKQAGSDELGGRGAWPN